METAYRNPMLAKAWVNFNGTGTPAITDSFNVTSITDTATGRFGINLSITMANANYCAVGMASGGTVAYIIQEDNTATKTTTYMPVDVESDASADSDLATNYVVIFGDV